MKRFALAVAVALAALLPGMAANADSYCARTGLTILGEPWLAHQFCVDCPVGPDCPSPAPDGTVPDQVGAPGVLTVQVEQ